jgi:hypothetical protein
VAEVLIRQATPEDWPGILKCHAQIEEKVGAKMDLPGLDDPAILVFEVAELDGEVISFSYQEKAIEYCMGGTDPRGTAAFKARVPVLFRGAKQLGVRFIHCAVPVDCAAVGKHLEDSGFYSTAESLRYFKLDLR